MPDISMCEGGSCPLKEECYRYRAKPNYHQTYLVDIPYDPVSGKCEAFSSIVGRYIPSK